MKGFKLQAYLPLSLYSLVTLLFFIMPVTAGVSIKNGNFHINYTDMVVPFGEQKMIIARTYNSRAMGTGWFGYGWGSEFETKLNVQGDGTIIVTENGTGSQTYFYPSKLRKGELEQYVIELVDAAERSDDIHSASERKTAYKELMHNAYSRQAWSKKYIASGQVEVRKLKPGTVLRSTERGAQRIVCTATGYVREYADGKQESFNLQGKYIQLRYQNGNVIRILRDNQGLPLEIIGNNGLDIHFDINDDGTVARVWAIMDGERKEANYSYLDKTLIWTKDMGDNSYQYKYDNIYNMISILYVNGDDMRITYDSRWHVRIVKKRNGNTVLYDYGALDTEDPNSHFFTEVVERDSDGEETSRNRYEYHTAERADGSTYEQRIATEVNGFRTETAYNGNGLPLSIKRGDRITTFKYNKKGLMTEKISDGQLTRLNYGGHGKITMVANSLVDDLDNAYITRFAYDNKKNLVRATDSRGREVKLIYDAENHIAELHSKKGSLFFEYNERGKPVQIANESGENMVISYDSYGEIESIEAGNGGDRRIALQITQMFQRFISLVKPAGVNFNM